ncbi:hypothetical protein KSS87_001353 [Heliosperma pusillum]|nr:hypothetical protein KSS87_001353 [Heliosperma pusillum]
MSLPCFITHCYIVTPCVNNESSLLHYLLVYIGTLFVNNDSSLLHYPLFAL